MGNSNVRNKSAPGVNNTGFWVAVAFAIIFGLVILVLVSVLTARSRYVEINNTCYDGNPCTADYLVNGQGTYPDTCEYLPLPYGQACNGPCTALGTGVCNGVGECTSAYLVGQCSYDLAFEDTEECPTLVFAPYSDDEDLDNTILFDIPLCYLGSCMTFVAFESDFFYILGECDRHQRGYVYGLQEVCTSLLSTSNNYSSCIEVQGACMYDYEYDVGVAVCQYTYQGVTLFGSLGTSSQETSISKNGALVADEEDSDEGDEDEEQIYEEDMNNNNNNNNDNKPPPSRPRGNKGENGGMKNPRKDKGRWQEDVKKRFAKNNKKNGKVSASDDSINEVVQVKNGPGSVFAILADILSEALAAHNYTIVNPPPAPPPPISEPPPPVSS